MTTIEAKKALNRFIYAGLNEFKIPDEDKQDEWLGYVDDVKWLVDNYDSLIEDDVEGTAGERINNSVYNLQGSMQHLVMDKCKGMLDQNKLDFVEDFASALNILRVKDDPSYRMLFERIYKTSN